MSEAEEAFRDWLADVQHDDPLLFEQRAGEGWTLADYRREYEDGGYAEN
jgi:hypothetical protein